nr:putative transposase En/Spm [Ipomoea batatas]
MWVRICVQRFPVGRKSELTAVLSNLESKIQKSALREFYAKISRFRQQIFRAKVYLLPKELRRVEKTASTFFLKSPAKYPAVILGVGCSSSYLLLSASFSLARYIIEKEKLGKDPSLADLYQHTHKRKNGDGAYVCAKAQKVMDTMNELRQTQTEASDVELWLEAIGGVKRGGYVYGFGSDTQQYFPKASKKSKSQAGASSSNAALMAEIQEMREENKMFRKENKFICEELSKMGAIFTQLSANPEFVKIGRNFPILKSLGPAGISVQWADVGRKIHFKNGILYRGGPLLLLCCSAMMHGGGSGRLAGGGWWSPGGWEKRLDGRNGHG